MSGLSVAHDLASQTAAIRRAHIARRQVTYEDIGTLLCRITDLESSLASAEVGDPLPATLEATGPCAELAAIARHLESIAGSLAVLALRTVGTPPLSGPERLALYDRARDAMGGAQ